MLKMVLGVCFILGLFIGITYKLNADAWNDIYFNDENGTFHKKECYQCYYTDALKNPKKYKKLNIESAFDYQLDQTGIKIGIDMQKFYQINVNKIKDKVNILGRFTNDEIDNQYASLIYDENQGKNYKLYKPYQMQLVLTGNNVDNVIKYDEINNEFTYKVKRVNGALESQGFYVRNSGTFQIDQKVVKQKLLDYLAINYVNAKKLEAKIKKLENLSKENEANIVILNQVDLQNLKVKIANLETEIKQLEDHLKTNDINISFLKEHKTDQLLKAKQDLQNVKQILKVLQRNKRATYHATYSEEYAKYIEGQNRKNTVKACFIHPLNCILMLIDNPSYFNQQITIDKSLTKFRLNRNGQKKYQSKIESLIKARGDEQEKVQIIEEIIKKIE